MVDRVTEVIREANSGTADDILRWARLLALKIRADSCNARITAMQCENLSRISQERSPAYDEAAFWEEAAELEEIANKLSNMGGIEVEAYKHTYGGG